jgi:hypothetical protein
VLGRVLCLLDHLTETDRCSKGQVFGLRPIPPTSTGRHRAKRFTFALSSVH